MYPAARQHVLSQDVEAVAPQARIQRIDRKDIQLDARFEQGPHVPLEEGSDPSGVLAGDYGELHDLAVGASPRRRLASRGRVGQGGSTGGAGSGTMVGGYVALARP